MYTSIPSSQKGIETHFAKSFIFETKEYVPKMERNGLLSVILEPFLNAWKVQIKRNIAIQRQDDSLKMDP